MSADSGRVIDLCQAIPAFLTIIVMPLTYSIACAPRLGWLLQLPDA